MVALRIDEGNTNLRRNPKLSWWVFFKRLYRRYEDHGLADSAATLGYYFLLSLFPFLFFLVTLAAFIPHAQSSVETLLEQARALLPSEARGVIEHHLRALVASSKPHLVTLGLAAALYSASRGVNAVRTALNRAYDVKESRPLWKTELLAFGVTVGGGLLLLVGIAVLLAGGSAGQWAARQLAIADEYVTFLRWIRWPTTAAAIMLTATLSYHLLPDVEQKFKFITPGTVIGTLACILVSWGLGFYASHFGSYNVTYGSIGGVIVLLLWFYLTGFILLVAGEMNAIIEDVSPGGKQSGARAFDQAPPPPDERPSAMPAGTVDSAAVAGRSRGGRTIARGP
jgi:membrane protein